VNKNTDQSSFEGLSNVEYSNDEEEEGESDALVVVAKTGDNPRPPKRLPRTVGKGKGVNKNTDQSSFEGLSNVEYSNDEEEEGESDALVVVAKTGDDPRPPKRLTRTVGKGKGVPRKRPRDGRARVDESGRNTNRRKRSADISVSEHVKQRPTTRLLEDFPEDSDGNGKQVDEDPLAYDAHYLLELIESRATESNKSLAYFIASEIFFVGDVASLHPKKAIFPVADNQVHAWDFLGWLGAYYSREVAEKFVSGDSLSAYNSIRNKVLGSTNHHIHANTRVDEMCIINYLFGDLLFQVDKILGQFLLKCTRECVLHSLRERREEFKLYLNKFFGSAQINN